MGKSEAAAALVPKGRREKRKHVTRHDLIAAGRRLFGTRGLYESRIEDLASRAGIAKGTLYGYFANKEELIRAVVAECLEDMLRAARGRGRPTRDARARMRGIIKRQSILLQSDPDLLRVLHQARGMLLFDRLEWRPLRPLFVAYLEEMGEILEGPKRTGQRTNMRRVARACDLFGILSGAISARAAFLSRGAVAPVDSALRDSLIGFARGTRRRTGRGSMFAPS